MDILDLVAGEVNMRSMIESIFFIEDSNTCSYPRGGYLY